MRPCDILHITPHLGGGVGASLLAILSSRSFCRGGFQHKVISLEENKTRKYCDAVIAAGIDVIEHPGFDRINEEIANSSIIQLEWWNHPLWFELLSRLDDIESRVILRPHINGLGFPVIPTGLCRCSDAIALTGRVVPKYMADAGFSEQIEWIPSVVELEKYAMIRTETRQRFVGGYCGTFDYGKMHPDYLSFLNRTIDLFDEFWFVGDWRSNPDFDQAVKKSRKFGSVIRCVDFVEDIHSIYEKLDCMLYLLNPYHYGTTENVLLESMSAGVVPIVMDNPIESSIVSHEKTGMVVQNEEELSAAIGRLRDDGPYRLEISRCASQHVRDQFKLQASGDAFNRLYSRLLTRPKTLRRFAGLFGREPHLWYEASLPDGGEATCRDNPMAKYIFLSPTKGSITHFQHYFGKF